MNDVDLFEQRTNGTVGYVTDVDVGLTGAALPGCCKIWRPRGVIRRIQDKLPSRLIRWEFVNLIESDPLRRVKLRITHQKLERMHPADLADIMEDLSHTERQSIIASLDEESPPMPCRRWIPGLHRRLSKNSIPSERRIFLRRWSPTRPPTSWRDYRGRCCRDAAGKDAGEGGARGRGALKFVDNSAGGVMSPEFHFRGRDRRTRAQAIEWIRTQDLKLEQLDTILQINGEAQLSGTVVMGQLLWLPKSNLSSN